MKKSLASILYYSLQHMGLRVFLDSGECELGDYFPDKIHHAICSASVHIAILSENYAHSPWCLAELALMLATDAKIVPVFYHVPPSVPRHCAGSYAEAFRKHELKGRYGKEQIDEWKAALHKASLYSGWEFNEHNDDQGKLWKNIVDTVLTEVRRRSSLEVAEHPVGLDQAVDDFNKRMAEFAQEREKYPNIVGIVGMGGSGKTTLARHLFNIHHSAFHASCFLFDVREASANNKLPALQRKLLKELLHVDYDIDSVSQGKEFLRSGFAAAETSRFLIILDDIDHNEQVDALLAKNVLRSDSLIIITSRDRSLFRRNPEAMLYEMKSMDENHARELFCLHAFRHSSPVSGFEDPVEGFLKTCDGLPLSLKVLGGHLFGISDKKEWGLELQKLSKVPNKDIKRKLQVSYDALERDERNMFLDIACFFIGYPKDTAIQIWNASGWSGEQGLQTLKYKSLIEVQNGGTLAMHNLLRDLGREMAAADKNITPRLWRLQDINPLQKKGFRRVLSSSHSFRSFLHLRCPLEKPQILLKSLRDLGKNKNIPAKDHSGTAVEFSRVDFFVGNDCLQPEVLNSSRDLLWLKWENCPHKSIPSWIPMKSLRHLEIIQGELKDLWQGTSEAPLQLRELIIRWNPLTVLPVRFGSLTNLEHIDFHGCDRLLMLPKSFSSLTQLQYLDLSECKSLKIEPCNLSFGQTQSDSLRTLRLLGTNVNKEVVNQIVKLNSLECLTIGSDSLTSLPSSLGNLTLLSVLCIGGCKRMKFLPASMRKLGLLTNLTIRSSGVEHLPEEIFGELTNLQALEVEDCPITDLTFTNSKAKGFGGSEQEIPCLNKSNGAFNNLPFSITECMSMCSLKNITLRNTKVRTILINEDFCPRLQTLNLGENGDLVEVDLTLPSKLESLCLSGCGRLKRISGISDLAKLKELAISGCCELEELPSLARLSALERFTADKCWKLQNTGGVEQLERLKDFRFLADNGAVWNCFHDLQRIPSQQMILGGRAGAVAGVGVESIDLSASDFSDGTAKDSFTVIQQEYVTGGDTLVNVWNSSCTSVVMIICFVIESFSENSWVRFWGFPGVLDLDGAVWIKAGEWIIASVFAIEKTSAWKKDIANLKKLQVLLSKSPHYKLKKAFITMVNKGGEDKITEILNKIFVSMKNTRAPEDSGSAFTLQDGVKGRECYH